MLKKLQLSLSILALFAFLFVPMAHAADGATATDSLWSLDQTQSVDSAQAPLDLNEINTCSGGGATCECDGGCTATSEGCSCDGPSSPEIEIE